MKIVFDDGEEQVCSEDDTRQVCNSGLRDEHPGKPGWSAVSVVPRLWGKLVTVRCSAIGVGAHVMTARGLRTVVRVEYLGGND